MKKVIYVSVSIVLMIIVIFIFIDQSKENIVLIENGGSITRINVDSDLNIENIIRDKKTIAKMISILKKYDTEKIENPFPIETEKYQMELDYQDNQKPRHIILGEINIIYESSSQDIYKIVEGDKLQEELRTLLSDQSTN